MMVIQDKDFLLKFEKRNNYLYAFGSGPKDNLEIAKRMWEKIYTKTKELGYKAVLIEEDFPNQISVSDMYEIGKLISNKFIGIKVAHVDKNINDIDLNEFGEKVAVNRGTRGKIFNNIKDAEEWIKHK